MNTLQAVCPVCDAGVGLQANTEESEIVNCGDCRTSLVVASVKGTTISLNEAPVVEEDWGE